MIITRDQVKERKQYHFIAEASDLGLAPGDWPVQLQTTVGNGMPFVFVRECRHDDELAYVEYAQIAGCITLKVFND
jgi:hypothetical protein